MTNTIERPITRAVPKNKGRFSRIGQITSSKGNDRTFVVLICAPSKEDADELQTRVNAVLAAFGHKGPIVPKDFEGSFFKKSEVEKPPGDVEQALLALYGNGTPEVAIPKLTSQQTLALSALTLQLQKNFETERSARLLAEDRLERAQDEQNDSKEEIRRLKDDAKKDKKTRLFMVIGSVLLLPVLHLNSTTKPEPHPVPEKIVVVEESSRGKILAVHMLAGGEDAARHAEKDSGEEIKEEVWKVVEEYLKESE